ncbi:MAG: DUF3267 domain-containing protein [Candidatus Cloacimonetes bacterium]|nr:DUF3267 domain-containing protein [Candidatus Cloacimonadota bacterium]
MENEIPEFSQVNNYDQEKIVFNIIWLNIGAAVFCILVGAVFVILYQLIWKVSFISILNLGYFPAYLFLIIFIILAFSHEAIHALSFAYFADNKFKSVKIGMMPKEKLFTPYCHCKELLKIKHYRIGAFMPMFVLGIIPVAISLLIGNNVLLTWGILMIVAGFGDFCFLLKLGKERGKDLVYDLPNEAGFIVYRNKTNR